MRIGIDKVFAHFLKDTMNAVAEDPDHIHRCQNLSKKNHFSSGKFIPTIENGCHNIKVGIL